MGTLPACSRAKTTAASAKVPVREALAFAEAALRPYHRTLLIIFTLVYAGFAWLHWNGSPRLAAVMAPVAGVTAVLGLLLVWERMALCRLPDRIALGLMTGLMAANSACHLWLEGAPSQTTNLAVVVLIAALFLFQWAEYLAILGAAIGAFAFAAAVAPAGGAWFHFGVHLGECVILATLIFVLKRGIAVGLWRSRLAERDARLAAEDAAALAQDLAEKAEAQAQAAIRANRAKSDFLANMSHELRTPLNAVLGFSDVMRDGDLPPERTKDYAGHIHRSGTVLLSMLNQVFDLAQAESGRMRLKQSWFPLDALLEDVITMIKPEAAKKGLLFHVPPPSGLDLYADRTRLSQTMLSLLSNAVKFTKRGAVSIGLHHSSAGLDLSVTDTGVGIEGKDFERILEPFTQADSSYSKSYQGSGLGLPLARHVMRAHEGDLLLKSKRGEGTTITLRLAQPRIRVHSSDLDLIDVPRAAASA